MSRNVFIINTDREYNALFEKLGFTLTKDFDKANLIVFTGGEDVSPDLYGDNKHLKTWNNPHRDEREQMLYSIACKEGIPMVGICRGAQLLNVLNGGRMYQDVGKHAVGAGHLLVDTSTHQEILVTSTHHQMMMPAEKAEVVAIANEGGYREWVENGFVEREEVSNEDYEVLYYADTNCLCFQPHPEFTGAKWEPMKEYFANLLQRYLGF